MEKEEVVSINIDVRDSKFILASEKLEETVLRNEDTTLTDDDTSDGNKE